MISRRPPRVALWHGRAPSGWEREGRDDDGAGTTRVRDNEPGEEETGWRWRSYSGALCILIVQHPPLRPSLLPSPLSPPSHPPSMAAVAIAAPRRGRSLSYGAGAGCGAFPSLSPLSFSFSSSPPSLHPAERRRLPPRSLQPPPPPRRLGRSSSRAPVQGSWYGLDERELGRHRRGLRRARLGEGDRTGGDDWEGWGSSAPSRVLVESRGERGMRHARRGQDSGACARAAPGEEGHDDGALILARSSRWAEGVGEAGDTERSPSRSLYSRRADGGSAWLER